MQGMRYMYSYNYYLAGHLAYIDLICIVSSETTFDVGIYYGYPFA